MNKIHDWTCFWASACRAQGTRMQECKNIIMKEQKKAIMQECKNENMKKYKNEIPQECKNTRIQECKMQDLRK